MLTKFLFFLSSLFHTLSLFHKKNVKPFVSLENSDIQEVMKRASVETSTLSRSCILVSEV